jgi:hypothetical protein
VNLIHNVISDFLKIPKSVNEYEAVEIIPCIRMENGESDRIIRITLYRDSYQRWSEMKPEDLYKEKPYEGIQCGWYWDKAKVVSI